MYYVTILKCVLGIFEKVYILAEKGLFRHFWTSFVILPLGTSNWEYDPEIRDQWQDYLEKFIKHAGSEHDLIFVGHRYSKRVRRKG